MLKTASARRLTGEWTSMPPVSVVTVPPKLTLPPPMRVTLTEPAFTAKLPVTTSEPVKERFVGPPLDAVTVPLLVMFVALMTMPDAVLVLIALLKVMVPPDSVKFIDAAVTAASVRFVQELTVRTPMRLVPPIAPLAVMLPVPAVKFRSKAPSTVLENVISPAPAPVFKVKAFVRVTALAKEIG